MEWKFGGFPLDEEMPERGAQSLVENAGTGIEGCGSWREWMAAKQCQQATDQQCLFQLLTN